MANNGDGIKTKTLVKVVEQKKIPDNKCLLCEKPGKLTSTIYGCDRINEAATLKKDAAILARLSQVTQTPLLFAYHLQCMKNYTHKKSLPAPEEELPATVAEADASSDDEGSQEDVQPPVPKKLRSSATPRAAPSFRDEVNPEVKDQ